MRPCELCFTLIAALVACPITAIAQVALKLDSAQFARGRALCGPVADDSLVLDPLWPPAGSLVSLRFPELEKPKILASRGHPEYPAHLRSEGVRGTVIVAVIVDTTGEVEPASVKVASTPHPDFIPVVERYLYGIRFSPGRLHSRLVRVCVVMPVSFFAPGH
jgi:TonB family protein